MQISISYASQRSEVWRWYWQAWWRGLWRVHLLIFVAVAISASMLIYGGLPQDILAFGVVAAIGVLPLIGLVLFPMWKFKPQERTLHVDEHGIETEIGHLSASVPWSDVANVREDGDSLVIQRRNLNAFIVPARAFPSDKAQSEFRDFVFEMTRVNGS